MNIGKKEFENVCDMNYKRGLRDGIDKVLEILEGIDVQVLVIVKDILEKEVE